MTKEQAFEKLKEYSTQLEYISYEDIYNLLRYSIKRIPIPQAKFNNNSKIYRARLNKGDELYRSINDLGYIKDKNVIDNYLNEYGRANKPHQVMFYGGVRTSTINEPRVTAIAETSKLFQNKNGHNLDGEKYTISRWRNNQEFFVAEIVFAKDAIKNNPDIKKAFNNQIKLADSLKEKDIEYYKEFLVFISEEFARRIEKNDDYKISVAYTNLILEHPEIEGIVFPSVQTNFLGANLVVPPTTVDKYFVPEVCSTQILYKTSDKTLFANGEHYCDTMEEDELKWKETEPQYLSSKEEIENYFK
ncbi:hypothetical protein [Elizabethkingia anophelis]|uniref:hypothetical protein n=1 Tax=Elizabethkingia anophelis TaxID=1117645 RepID=UPI00063ABAC4|nr:hypothetical protein [Elizabethkingia anophelis]AKH93223.1 hypothetical protein M876_01405 [Elizabethkingia anophelis FMS-007]EJC8058891.1 hypothetical protein [Elizabethkingia anophelis]MCL1640338.1 hypothetical protein [Elizabethkingia anophelis]MCL1645244.1 hypothetical protein [Elizabethkingia anophelis]MCT3943552.1 hypothetical protein [Elizabethkingia anophelis]